MVEIELQAGEVKADFFEVGEDADFFEGAFDAVFGIKIEEACAADGLAKIEEQLVVKFRCRQGMDGHGSGECLEGADESFVVGFDGFFETAQEIGKKACGMTPGVVSITACRHNDHAALSDDVVDKAVAFKDGVVRDAPVAKFVVLGHIDASEIEHEFGLDLVYDVWQGRPDCFEIACIAIAWSESYVKVHFCRFAVPVFGVYRIGCHGWVVCKDFSRSVPLVQIEVDDEDRRVESVFSQVCNRHGHVVEHAERIAAFGVGMVESAAKIDDTSRIKARHGHARSP